MQVPGFPLLNAVKASEVYIYSEISDEQAEELSVDMKRVSLF